MYPILLIILLSVFNFLPTAAQPSKPVHLISGRTTINTHSSSDTEALPYANITLLQLPDSSYITGTTSNEKGYFRMKYSPKSNSSYLLKASYLGCTPIYREVNPEEKDIKLGTLTLNEDIKKLKEVVVTALLPPTEQKGDTTIYNTEAYKTPEGAYLEALIQRIPGLNYNTQDKSITYKGYPIQEITVNGKEFFTGNHRVALENLPADFFSRIKVYDKATEEEKITGVKGQTKNYILDLQTKKEMNGSLMAGLEGGYGNKGKFDSQGQIFQFKDNGENLSLVGSFGNRSITDSYRGNHNGTLGGNLAKNLGKNMKLAGYLNYYHSKTGGISTSRNEQYLSSENQYGISSQELKGIQHSATSFVNFSWDINPQTMLHLSGNANFYRSRNFSLAHSAKFNENPEADLQNPFEHFEETASQSRINEMKQNNRNYTANQQYSFNANLVHKLNDKGNSIGFSFSTSVSRQNNEGYKNSASTFYQLQNIHGKDSVCNLNQYSLQPVLTFNHEVKVYYTQKLTPKDFLQVSTSFICEKKTEDQDTYDISQYGKDFLPEDNSRPHLPSDYARFRLDSLSNHRNKQTCGGKLSISYTHEGENWYVNGGLGLSPQKRKLKQEDHQTRLDTLGRFIEWTPFVSIQFKKNDYDFSLNYNGNTHQPSLYELMAPTMYISALYISRSNPNLKPSYQQMVTLSLSNYALGFSTYLTYSQDFNGITQATLYHPETGGRETYPVNINGNWNLSGNANYEKRFGEFKWNIRGGGNYSREVGLIDEEGNRQLQKSVTHQAGIDTNTELSYLPSWGNLNLIATWNFQQFRNSLNEDRIYHHYYTVGTSVSAQLPLHFQIDSDFKYNIRCGSQIKSEEEQEALWNLKLKWKFTKAQRAEVSFLWADILSQRKNLRRTASPNGFYEYYTEQLGSYFMVSLKYRLNQTH